MEIRGGGDVVKAIEEVIIAIAKDVKLEKAKKNLRDFLNKNPELKEYQEEMDRLLALAITPENRLSVLQFMMADNLNKLAGELTKLQKVLLEVRRE
jgi:hypothetical protein